MRDNGNREPGGGSHGGAGQIRPVHWTRTEHQVKSHDGFSPEAITVRDPVSPSTSDGYTMQLARPPSWTHRDDLPCTELVPEGNRPDPFDTSNDAKAEALCAGCPVMRECLMDALADEEGLGPRSRWLVRGGLTPKGRHEWATGVVSCD